MHKKQNKIIYQDNIVTKFAIISKIHGEKEITIDTKDWEKVKNYTWYVTYDNKKKRYKAILSKARHSPGVLLHNLIMNSKPNDHKDGDIFNNRKCNLRKCTSSQNNCNRKIPKNNTSGLKGVSWHKNKKKWEADITINNKTIFLGLYKDKIEAALAYNKAAIKYHGEFARLNQI